MLEDSQTVPSHLGEKKFGPKFSILTTLLLGGQVHFLSLEKLCTLYENIWGNVVQWKITVQDRGYGGRAVWVGGNW